MEYNDYYKRHGMMAHLLVDFDGYIVAVQTNVQGRVHDANAAQYNKLFPSILGNKFALGDPGYARVSSVVDGLKSNQLNSQAAREFDKITRTEQVIIEHINKHIKGCKVLSKRHMFMHGRELHICCVFIICGWFNWMKESFDKY